jgi:CheY-like chemotaxis protein
MKKVVVAEDIKAVLEKEHSFLNRASIKIFTATTNKKAISLHKARKADLIIANLDSPEMNGETLCSLIRNDPELSEVSIIIVGAGNESDPMRCLQCRANAFIPRPINTAVLLQEAHQLLNIAPRLALRVPLGVKLSGTKKEKPFAGSIENISASGMLFRSAVKLFEGDTIQCLFSLPDSTHITTTAEIMRLVPKRGKGDTNRYGITFNDLSGDAISAIEAIIKKKHKRL